MANNNILSTIDERLFVLMKEQMNTEEQQQFIDSFKVYLEHGDDDTKFIIDFDNIWSWVGFSQKIHAKTLLTKKFVENIDYIVNKNCSRNCESNNNNNEKREAWNKENILLTVNVFTPLRI